MRLTVGPLPAAIYWRRRLFVLTGLLLLVFGVWTACGGPDSSAGNKGSQAANSASTNPTTTPSTELLVPIVGGSDSPSAGSVSTSAGLPSQGQGQLCADGELSLTPSATPNPTAVASTTTLTFVIKNIAGRTCDRDVGGLPQELRIMQGNTLIWSSDHCKPVGSSVVRTLKPGDSVTATVYWDGRKTVRDGKVDCTKPAPIEMRVDAGIYQLVGRLDNAYSAAIELQVIT